MYFADFDLDCPFQTGQQFIF